MPGKRLIMFYGTECPHCHAMMPVVDRLQKEEKVKVDKLEVWHNPKNAAVMQKYDTGLCGGVPFFYNEKTKKWLCGEAPFAKLKAWTKG